MSEELYLILHKVRGTPAFDIAQQIETEDGEQIWIIPTSGHRAYPYDVYVLEEVIAAAFGDNYYEGKNMEFRHIASFDSWPDHYPTSKSPAETKTKVSNLLSALGLIKPSQPVRRI